jgi:hypothetical protein
LEGFVVVHRSEGRGFGVRIGHDGFRQLVLELGLAVPLAVRDGLDADQAGLAEGGSQ